MLLNVPLFHITGSVPVLLVSIAIGRKMVIMHKWDAGEALRLIEKERATYFVGVPTMSARADAAPGPRQVRPVEPGRHRQRWRAATARACRPAWPTSFPGKHPVQGYGLTETNGVGAGNFRDNYRSTSRPRPAARRDRWSSSASPTTHGKPGWARTRSAKSASAPPPTAAATGTSRRRRPPRSRPTGGSRPATSACSTTTVTCSSSTARRTSSSAAAKTSAARRSRARSMQPSGGRRSQRLRPARRAARRDRRRRSCYPKPGAALEADALHELLSRDLASFKVPSKIWLVAEPLPKLGSAKIDKVDPAQAIPREVRRRGVAPMFTAMQHGTAEDWAHIAKEHMVHQQTAAPMQIMDSMRRLECDPGRFRCRSADPLPDDRDAGAGRTGPTTRRWSRR